MRVADLAAFIHARHDVFVKRAEGRPKPWTTEPILQQWRFCNVYRELDTVTAWIAENWRGPMTYHPDVWFAMAVARLINWPETLAHINPLPWNAKHFVETIRNQQTCGKAYGGAYIVSTNGREQEKCEYLAGEVLSPLWAGRKLLSRRKWSTLAEFWCLLRKFNGMGSFMAAQVVADAKFTETFAGVPDFWTFAASGPGSRRGLNRVLGRPVAAPWGEGAWFHALQELNTALAPAVASLPRISAQDLQNCLCEFDKYERVRLGEGFPRARYQGV